jgi:hypothetical protein
MSKTGFATDTWLVTLLDSRSLSHDDVIAIAKAECAAENWAWLEPVFVETKPSSWIVATSQDLSGRHARIVVSKRTHEVLCKSFVRRPTRT